MADKGNCMLHTRHHLIECEIKIYMDHIWNIYGTVMLVTYGMNVLGFDGEVQVVVLSITVVASLVPPTIGSRPPFIMFYSIVIITFCPPSKFFILKHIYEVS